MNYIDKVESMFNNIIYHSENIQEFLIEDIDDMNFFLRIYYYEKKDFFNNLNELDLRLRALRDKLENG